MPVIRIVSMTGKYGRRPRKAAYKMFPSPLGLHKSRSCRYSNSWRRQEARPAIGEAAGARMGAATGSNVRNSFCPDNCPGSRRNREDSLERSLITLEKDWSEWQDLNLRPPRPERGVPPG